MAIEIVDRCDWQRAGKILGTVAFVAVVFLFVTTAVPQVAGADRSFIVLSDSMSPSIGAGSVVYVNEVPTAQISEGDVITYRSESGDAPVTHRVVDIVQQDGERRFRTKGDANEEADADLISSAQVVGRVSISVPYIGYVISFAGTGLGTALLVVIPALLLVVLELRDLLLAGNRDRGSHTEGEAE